MKEKGGFTTRAVHAGQKPNELTGAVVEPIYQCSVFAQKYPAEFKYDYGRSMNPNFYPLEEALASLESAKYGTVVSSGVAAMTAVMTLVKAGDKVLMPTDVYGGTYRLFKQVFENFGVQYIQVDLLDLNKVEEELKARPRMLYMESPTNPLLNVYDLKALAALGKKYGAISVVDNSFATPYFQTPISLGADIVIHSASKYLGGHSDIVAGVVLTNDEKVQTQMDFARKSIGLHIDPNTMFLLRRSLKTFPLRMERHQQNAFCVAEYLEKHPKVERVLYPGLKSHPHHETAKGQMRGYSGMLSVFFKLKNDDAKKLISSFKIITLAESLGCVESLVEHPASMTHQKIPADVRKKHGLSDGLVRFSIGIEDSDDLLEDLESALAKV